MVGIDKSAGAVDGVLGRSGMQIPIAYKEPGSVASLVATPFSGVLKGIMEQTQELSKKASDAVSGLLSGQGVEIHDVMIAQQKADASFELAMQVRNKAVGAYQQLMGMQF